MNADKTLKLIDTHLENTQESGNRWHLGASVLGRECAREIWYKYRWCKEVRHKGQLLRLFERGHLEEDRFVKYLRDIGCEVWDVNPETGKQFTISAVEGHLGGSLDGVGKGIPDIPPDEAFLTEFKTSNDKGFKTLQKEGVKKAKHEHYVQTQLYMNQYDLKYCLYMAVNKNTDELYLEVIELDARVAGQYLERGKMIIMSNEPPPRVSNTPGWYKCKMCDYHGVCHKGEEVAMNCRTCRHSKPHENRQWVCTLHGEVYAKPTGDEISMTEVGCAQYHVLESLEG